MSPPRGEVGEARLDGDSCPAATGERRRAAADEPERTSF